MRFITDIVAMVSRIHVREGMNTRENAKTAGNARTMDKHTSGNMARGMAAAKAKPWANATVMATGKNKKPFLKCLS